MLSDIAEHYPQIEETFTEASDALGYDMKSLVMNGPAEELNKTEKTQPALVTVSTALYRAWSSRMDVQPALFAGHSLGEYSALVASGAISFADAVRVVELRGQLMQQAVPAGYGLMAAILGLTDEQVIEGCEKASEGEVVSAVNFNTPGQVVIAGQKTAVERAIEILKEMGAKRAMPLSVSVPSHCALMEPAAEKLALEFEKISFNTPSAPIVQNRVAQGVLNVDELRKNLLEQLYQPVLWTKSVEYIAAQGVSEIIECGPGKVLTGLNRRVAKELTHTVLGDLASFEKRTGA
jgi:[acyl-carrier-protein] S-malonyltransferase